MGTFNPDRFVGNTGRLANFCLQLADPQEAAFMCIAAAASIVSLTMPADKDIDMIAVLQNSLAELVAVQRQGSARCLERDDATVH